MLTVLGYTGAGTRGQLVKQADLLLRMAVLGAALCIGAEDARAGAWPREEGAYFIAIGGNVALSEAAQRPVHYDPTLYVEYGLTGDLTVGLDGYLADAGDAGSGYLFARYPLRFGPFGDPDGPWRLAASVGVGRTIMPSDEVQGSLRAGVHLGYGMESGWIAVDADLVQFIGTGELQGKLAGTWGVDLNARWTAIFEAQVGTGLTGDVYAKVSPSIAWHPNERWTLRIGLAHALTGDRGTGFMVQTWLEF